MKRPVHLLPILLLAATACAGDAEPPSEMEAQTGEETEAATAAGPAEWSYAGTTGPEVWGELSADYTLCAAGREQSPVDIPADPVESPDRPALQISWSVVDLTFEETGYGMKGTVAGEPGAMLGDRELTLLQLHPHAPSEHTVAGESFPAEVHFVHQTSGGGLAVIGVLLEEGEPNPVWGSLATAMEVGSVESFELVELLPESRSHYTYSGSLTTPPCTEGVRWIVLEEPVQLSPEQIQAVAGGYGPTNRPIQPLHDREVRAVQ